MGHYYIQVPKCVIFFEKFSRDISLYIHIYTRKIKKKKKKIEKWLANAVKRYFFRFFVQKLHFSRFYEKIKT